MGALRHSNPRLPEGAGGVTRAWGSDFHVLLFSSLRHKSAQADYSAASCRNPGSNQGPLDLQSNASPTELFRHLCQGAPCLTEGAGGVTRVVRRWPSHSARQGGSLARAPQMGCRATNTPSASPALQETPNHSQERRERGLGSRQVTDLDWSRLKARGQPPPL
ncbi:hypothetical protein KOW79_003884 [Hemibagrus wyckioides]|uniref:Uncharacterized protein n=1 Tax=Hemibagrus wyckioides TaxID=337641 RepID=A0A9D3NZV6_9TELE|nr:hypothetical protein KOW79_003884 [Hemibagrus wyckioides]